MVPRALIGLKSMTHGSSDPVVYIRGSAMPERAVTDLPTYMNCTQCRYSKSGEGVKGHNQILGEHSKEMAAVAIPIFSLLLSYNRRCWGKYGCARVGMGAQAGGESVAVLFEITKGKAKLLCLSVAPFMWCFREQNITFGASEKRIVATKGTMERSSERTKDGGRYGNINERRLTLFSCKHRCSFTYAYEGEALAKALAKALARLGYL